MEQVLKQPEQMERADQSSEEQSVFREMQNRSAGQRRRAQPARSSWDVSAGCPSRELVSMSSGQLEKQIWISPPSSTTSLPLL